VEVGDTTVLKTSFGTVDLSCRPKISSTCRALGRRILFFASLGALANAIVAQGVSIQGHVADPQGNAVLHAPVSLTTSEDKNVQQRLTGNEGQFSFSGVAAGKYTLKVAVSGFEPFARDGTTEDFGDLCREGGTVFGTVIWRDLFPHGSLRMVKVTSQNRRTIFKLAKQTFDSFAARH
jgi:Carboxypeptidase regulatory-like domain